MVLTRVPVSQDTARVPLTGIKKLDKVEGQGPDTGSRVTDTARVSSAGTKKRHS